MKRKKWTAKEDITESDLVFREKRKWQLALRRYILERNPSQVYAPYFGLSIEDFRYWISLQFTSVLNWENFADAWQFDHIVPISYFNFNNEEDLKLCWNFINIRVEVNDINKIGANTIDVLTAQPYFERLYQKTGYEMCNRMLVKIKLIQENNIQNEPVLESFIRDNKQKFELLSTLDSEDYYRLNKGGILLDDLILEKSILKKFG
jgi:hypothetical protein